MGAISVHHLQNVRSWTSRERVSRESIANGRMPVRDGYLGYVEQCGVDDERSKSRRDSAIPTRLLPCATYNQ